jgi:uroporphyrinogen-III synthase
LGNRPLRGRRILVTRPKHLAAGLRGLIEQAGGEAVLFPAIEIVDVPAPPALGRLAEYDMAIFVSPTAAQRAVSLLKALPENLSVAAVGAGTKRELERLGVSRVIAPVAGADSEALLAVLNDVRDKRVLILRGEGGREWLGETLAARGAKVEYAPCYRRVRPRSDAASLPEVDAVTASSADGLDNLLEMLGERARDVPWFVPHARVAEHASARGLRKVIVAGPADDEMHAALVAYFSRP